jgi:hypothetical protein
VDEFERNDVLKFRRKPLKHVSPPHVRSWFYLYGDQSAGTVARETPPWQTWIQERFPMPSETSKSE